MILKNTLKCSSELLRCSFWNIAEFWLQGTVTKLDTCPEPHNLSEFLRCIDLVKFTRGGFSKTKTQGS